MLILNKSITVQDYLLNELRKNKIETTVFLVNGASLRHCIITSFDAFVIVVENQKKQKVLYKHAISTIEPSKKINLAKRNDK